MGVSGRASRNSAFHGVTDHAVGGGAEGHRGVRLESHQYQTRGQGGEEEVCGVLEGREWGGGASGGGCGGTGA